MEWSKLKTIILLMLAGVNLFLLLLVGLRAGRGAVYEEEARQAAAQVLEEGGITFGLEQVPDDISLPVLSLTRDREREEADAQSLLGDVTREESGVRPRYTGAGGTAEFSMNGSFLVEFSGTAHSLQPGQDVADASRAYLARIGFQATEGWVEHQGDLTVFTCLQLWEGTPVFSCPATLTWQGSSLVRMEGVRLAGEASAGAGQSLLSTPTVLLRFLSGISQGGYVCSRIDGMEAGYLAAGSSRTVQLSPVWRVRTDTGYFYVDAATGAVTPAE